MRTVAWDFAQAAPGEVVPGPLWSFTDDPGAVQQCPAFVGPSTFGSDPYTGFNYNTSFIGTEGSYPMPDESGRMIGGWARARHGVRVAQHRRPAQTALFGDVGWLGGANKFMRSPSSSVEGDVGTTYAGGQAFRHLGCTNVAWLDGHVSGVCQACRGVHATDALLASPMDFTRNGFLSEDDSAYDPRWPTSSASGDRSGARYQRAQCARMSADHAGSSLRDPWLRVREADARSLRERADRRP